MSYTMAQARKVLDSVLHSEKGITIKLPNEKSAHHLRMLCNKVRSRDRQANKKMYPEDDPRHGRSIWDDITSGITKRPDGSAELCFHIEALEDLTIIDNATGDLL